MIAQVATQFKEVHSVIPHIGGVVFKQLAQYEDDAGWSLELFRDDELPEDNNVAMACIRESFRPASVKHS